MGWLEFLAASGAVTSAVGLFKFALNWYHKRYPKQSIYMKELSRRGKVGPLVRRIVDDANAIRAGVCVAKNGGAQPNPTCKLTSSICQNEVDARAGQDDLSDDWNSQPLSSWYIYKLVDVAKDGMVTFLTEDIPDKEPLKHLFDHYGVKKARAYEIARDDGAFYYLFAHFDSDKALNASQEEVLRSSISGIRNAYRDYLRSS